MKLVNPNSQAMFMLNSTASSAATPSPRASDCPAKPEDRSGEAGERQNVDRQVGPPGRHDCQEAGQYQVPSPVWQWFPVDLVRLMERRAGVERPRQDLGVVEVSPGRPG